MKIEKIENCTKMITSCSIHDKEREREKDTYMFFYIYIYIYIYIYSTRYCHAGAYQYTGKAAA